MANKKHLRIIKQGVDGWNQWRKDNPEVEPDLSGANLKGLDLKGLDLKEADFNGADIRGTNFKGAELEGANFSNVKAGLQELHLLAISVASSFLVLLLGILSLIPGSLFFSVVPNIMPIITEQRSDYVHMLTTFAFFLVLSSIMVIALRHQKFYLVAVIIVITMPVFGIAVGTASEAGVLTGSVALALSLSLILALSGAGGLIGSGTGVMRTAGGFGAMAMALTVVILLDKGILDILKTLTGVGAGICILFLSFYIAWVMIYEDYEQFSGIRKLSIFIASFGRTNFESSNLKNADFTDSILKSTRFEKTTNLTNTCWKNAQKIERSQRMDTILKNRAVRELLVTLDGKNKSFNSLNLRGAYLKGADIRNCRLQKCRPSQRRFNRRKDNRYQAFRRIP